MRFYITLWLGANFSKWLYCLALYVFKPSSITLIETYFSMHRTFSTFDFQIADIGTSALTQGGFRWPLYIHNLYPSSDRSPWAGWYCHRLQYIPARFRLGLQLLLCPMVLKTSKTNIWFQYQFHNWTSKLASIWHILRKLGYFWLFLSAPVWWQNQNICTGALKKSQK